MRSHAIRRAGFISALALTTAALGVSAASAQTGGAAPPGSTLPASTPAAAPGAKAKLLRNGRAVAPKGAPQQVVDAIWAGNRIRKRKYVWGGGHASFFSGGYDCSGAVSFLLYGAGLLTAPMPSGPFMSWASPGPGAWITTYANGGHMFVVVAGLRFDTSSAFERRRKGKKGSGPRWRNPRPTTRFVARHPAGL